HDLRRCAAHGFALEEQQLGAARQGAKQVALHFGELEPERFGVEAARPLEALDHEDHCNFGDVEAWLGHRKTPLPRSCRAAAFCEEQRTTKWGARRGRGSPAHGRAAVGWPPRGPGAHPTRTAAPGRPGSAAPEPPAPRAAAPISACAVRYP